MRGDYTYAPIKFMVCKVVSGGQLLFLDGEFTEASTLTIAFKKGLTKGEYLIIYQAEFSQIHPLRKLVCSVYCEDNTTLKVLANDNLSCARLDEYLSERL